VGAAHPSFLEGGRRPPKLFFRLGGRAHHEATEKNKNRNKNNYHNK